MSSHFCCKPLEQKLRSALLLSATTSSETGYVCLCGGVMKCDNGSKYFCPRSDSCCALSIDVLKLTCTLSLFVAPPHLYPNVVSRNSQHHDDVCDYCRVMSTVTPCQNPSPVVSAWYDIAANIIYILDDIDSDMSHIQKALTRKIPGLRALAGPERMRACLSQKITFHKTIRDLSKRRAYYQTFLNLIMGE
jgi:hypothetical protein